MVGIKNVEELQTGKDCLLLCSYVDLIPFSIGKGSSCSWTAFGVFGFKKNSTSFETSFDRSAVFLLVLAGFICIFTQLL